MPYCGYAVLSYCYCVAYLYSQELMASTGFGVELSCEGSLLMFSVKELAQCCFFKAVVDEALELSAQGLCCGSLFYSGETLALSTQDSV